MKENLQQWGVSDYKLISLALDLRQQGSKKTMMKLFQTRFVIMKFVKPKITPNVYVFQEKYEIDQWYVSDISPPRTADLTV